jgi:hypothetical protein
MLWSSISKHCKRKINCAALEQANTPSQSDSMRRRSQSPTISSQSRRIGDGSRGAPTVMINGIHVLAGIRNCEPDHLAPAHVTAYIKKEISLDLPAEHLGAVRDSGCVARVEVVLVSTKHHCEG